MPRPASRYSAKVSKLQSMPASSMRSDMSSTAWSVRTIGAAVLGARRRDREAAVAGDDRRDAVPARRREPRIPEHLRVVVGVDVEEAGRHVTTAWRRSPCRRRARRPPRRRVRRRTATSAGARARRCRRPRCRRARRGQPPPLTTARDRRPRASGTGWRNSSDGVAPRDLLARSARGRCPIWRQRISCESGQVPSRCG